MRSQGTLRSDPFCFCNLTERSVLVLLADHLLEHYPHRYIELIIRLYIYAYCTYESIYVCLDGLEPVL